MFMQDRFRALSPLWVEFKAMKPQKIIAHGVEREKTSHHKPRGLRCSWAKPEKGRKPMSQLIDAEKSCKFWSYEYTLGGVTPNLFYTESSKEIFLVPREDVPINLYFLLAMITSTPLS